MLCGKRKNEDKMNLFTIKSQLTPANLNPLNLQTPLGDLFFDCQMFNESLLIKHPSNIMTFNSGSTWASWTSANYTAEFIKMSFLPKLPEGMRIDECIFAVWRVKVLKKLRACQLSCKFNNNLEGSPESGEGLASQSFQDNSHALSIGTQDEDYLQQRSASNNWLPVHLKSKISANEINYLPSGFEITLPDLLAEDSIQIHFIISWTSNKDSSISNWFAVDQRPKRILEEAGIS